MRQRPDQPKPSITPTRKTRQIYLRTSRLSAEDVNIPQTQTAADSVPGSSKDKKINTETTTESDLEADVIEENIHSPPIIYEIKLKNNTKKSKHQKQN